MDYEQKKALIQTSNELLTLDKGITLSELEALVKSRDLHFHRIGIQSEAKGALNVTSLLVEGKFKCHQNDTVATRETGVNNCLVFETDDKNLPEIRVYDSPGNLIYYKDIKDGIEVYISLLGPVPIRMRVTAQEDTYKDARDFFNAYVKPGTIIGDIRVKKRIRKVEYFDWIAGSKFRGLLSISGDAGPQCFDLRNILRYGVHHSVFTNVGATCAGEKRFTVEFLDDYWSFLVGTSHQ